jgi:ribosomal protein S18 acetylase RimI-like enzyme
MGCARCPMSWEARVGRWQALGEIQIREVLPGEYRDTGSLIQRAYAEYARPSDPLWAEYFGMLADVARRAAVATVLVAVAGGRIVGTATVELDRTLEGAEDLQPGQANFRLLAVDPVARGGGVGRRLVEACVEVARRAGKQVATLHTTEQMVVAQRIYRSLGFRREPSREVEPYPDLVLQAFRLPLRSVE